MGMYWAQHGDETYQCSPRKYEACWSVYIVNCNLSYCDFKCKFPSAVLSVPHCCVKFEDKRSIFEQNVQRKLIFAKSQCTVSHHLLCNTWPDVFLILLLSYLVFWFDLIWLRSDVDKLSSNRKQSSQGSTEATKGNVTLWVISALFMNPAQSRVALNSLINWLFKWNAV